MPSNNSLHCSQSLPLHDHPALASISGELKIRDASQLNAYLRRVRGPCTLFYNPLSRISTRRYSINNQDTDRAKRGSERWNQSTMTSHPHSQDHSKKQTLSQNIRELISITTSRPSLPSPRYALCSCDLLPRPAHYIAAQMSRF